VKNAVFLKPLCHRLILDIWRAYLGPDMICSTWTANYLFPNSDHIYWHADHPYWTIAPPFPQISLCGQTIWMLDDFTEENGATAGMPFSHKKFQLPQFGNQMPPDCELLVGVRGSVIMADGAWWHTSTANKTNKPRSALLGTYIRSFCVPQENLRAQLKAIRRPSRELRQIMGGNQYEPRLTFPY